MFTVDTTFGKGISPLRGIRPELDLWRSPPYEYEKHRLPIDVINGGASLREWVDAAEPQVDRLEAALETDEREWMEARKPFLMY